MDLARGKPWNPNSSRVHTRLRRAYARAGVSGKKPTHGLRHTLASDLVQSGAPIHVAQRMLGHSSAVVTLQIYAHAQRTGIEEAGKALEHFRKRR